MRQRRKRAPMAMAATCCGSVLGSCAASMLCKACSCYCVASPRIASGFYFGVLMFFAFFAMLLRFDGGDIVLGGDYNSTVSDSIINHAAHMGTAGALEYWNSRTECAPARPCRPALPPQGGCAQAQPVHACLL